MICPVPLGASVKFSLETVVISVAAPENVNPVAPMVLFVNVCDCAAKTNVSSPVSAGIVAIREADGVAELIVVVFPAPKMS